MSRPAERNKQDSVQIRAAVIRSLLFVNWWKRGLSVGSILSLSSLSFIGQPWGGHWKPSTCLRKSSDSSKSHAKDRLTVWLRNEISKDVCQGIISPLLFNTVLDTTMSNVFEGIQGVQYDDKSFVTDLTDDSAIFADTDAKATNILYVIAYVTQPYYLKINPDKTKVLTMDGSHAMFTLTDQQTGRCKVLSQRRHGPSKSRWFWKTNDSVSMIPRQLIV